MHFVCLFGLVYISLYTVTKTAIGRLDGQFLSTFPIVSGSWPDPDVGLVSLIGTLVSRYQKLKLSVYTKTSQAMSGNNDNSSCEKVYG